MSRLRAFMKNRLQPVRKGVPCGKKGCTSNRTMRPRFLLGTLPMNASLWRNWLHIELGSKPRRLWLNFKGTLFCIRIFVHDLFFLFLLGILQLTLYVSRSWMLTIDIQTDQRNAKTFTTRRATLTRKLPATPLLFFFCHRTRSFSSHTTPDWGWETRLLPSITSSINR